MENKRKIILCLRWALIIVTSYLILFGNEFRISFDSGHLLILVYILSNVALTFAPKKWFSSQKIFYSLVIVDTAIVSLGMYSSERVATDFYLVFFLIILFASVSRDFKLLMTISAITCLIYGALLYSWGLLYSEHGIHYVLRVPFIFIVSAFYGTIVLSFAREKQKALAISEDRYGNLFENANDGIMILKNPQMLIADVNRGVEKLTEFTKEELLGRNVLGLFRLTDKEKASSFLDKVAQEGEGRTDTLCLMRKNGNPLEADLSIKRIRLGNESFYQLIFRDLTEHRKLEKKIREAKRNLEAIFDGIRDQLSAQSPEYQILRVNRAVSQKYHSDFRELIGKKCYETYYQRSRPCEKCPVAVTLQTKAFASTVMTIPGEDTTFRICSYPIFDEKGNIFSVIEHVQDITDEQRLQEQLVQSEKLAGIGYLASGVAHEINNPLSGIIGMAEAAQEEEDLPTIKSHLGAILNCSHRISEIVKGLRSYCRVAKQEELSRVDINEVLDDSVKMVRMGLKAGAVEVARKFEPVEKVEANLGELQQVFVNLITNAFQAVNGKGGTVTLSTRSLKDIIEVKVSDTGVGIPQKYLGKIFDPFFTTKKTGEGTGLGLNVVYRIVSKYGGTIDVESKEGSGATFTVRVPTRREEG
ncbi:MAG: ATP-binding protein [Deltaproteobacteria bacterium]